MPIPCSCGRCPPVAGAFWTRLQIIQTMCSISPSRLMGNYWPPLLVIKPPGYGIWQTESLLLAHLTPPQASGLCLITSKPVVLVFGVHHSEALWQAWGMGWGRIRHWDGTSWITTRIPTSQGIAKIDMISTTEGWAVGYGGAILHFRGDAPVGKYNYLPIIGKLSSGN